MSRVHAAILASLAWGALGLLTLAPVDGVLRDRCQPALESRGAVLGHVVAWPVSVLATWGIRSRC